MNIRRRFFSLMLVLAVCITMTGMPVFAVNEPAAITESNGDSSTSDDSVDAEMLQTPAEQDAALEEPAEQDAAPEEPADEDAQEVTEAQTDTDRQAEEDIQEEESLKVESIYAEEQTEEAERMMLKVSDEGYYIIETPDDLNSIRNNLSAKYRLEADIDLSNTTASGGAYNNGGRGWNPIGLDEPFAGIFDGNGHTITGLRIAGSNLEYAGLFGVNAGTIRNLSVGEGTISGDIKYAGGITGYNTEQGTIEACSNSSGVSADSGSSKSYAGGITGINRGEISQCYNTGTLTAVDYIGGIAGANSGTISDCYHAGSIVSAEGTYSGGIVGVNSRSASITNVYSIGTLKGDRAKAGSIAGVFAGTANGDIIACDLGLLNTAAGGTMIGEEHIFADMEKKATFSGFDFSGVWTMGTGTYKLPVLLKCPDTNAQSNITIPIKDVYMGPVTSEVYYDGTLKKPNIFVSGLELDKNYTIDGGGTEVGEATVTVTGIAPFTGTGEVKFIIREPKLSVKSLWASQHDVGKVKFKFTVKDGETVTGWNLKYRWRKIGGDNEWSDWELLDNLPASVGGAGDSKGYWVKVPTDYAIELHAQAVGDTTWSTGIITTPAGGKYQAMKTTYVKNTNTGKRVGSTIAIKKGATIKVRPDYEYSVKDYKKRPRLYPNHLLYDVSDKSIISITKPDGTKYTAGMIDGVATIKGEKVGSTKVIFRSPNGRTQVSTIVVTN